MATARTVIEDPISLSSIGEEKSPKRVMKVYYEKGPATPKHIRESSLNVEDFNIVDDNHSK